jgi:hypothetical protein
VRAWVSHIWNDRLYRLSWAYRELREAEQARATDTELRSMALSIRDQHDPTQQSHSYQGRCAECGFVRHPCDTYEMAAAVLRLLDR